MRECLEAARIPLAVLAVVAVTGGLAGCARRLQPLTGLAPAPGTILPAMSMAPGARRITFRWELDDGTIVARGDGVARISPPDSARVDLFVGGGFGGAAAIVIGDSLRTPPGAMGTRMIPPAPLLWATLGRLALPALPDTVIRVAGDTLRATLGRPVQWRIEAVAGALRRVERVAGDRIVEWVQRGPRRVRYELAGQRTLQLDIEHDQPSPPYDASVWRF